MYDSLKIRKFESEILDKHHLSFELYSYSEDIVIPYLLQSYGDIGRYRDIILKNNISEFNFQGYLTNMTHGISHCIRWVKKQEKSNYDEIPDNLSISEFHNQIMDFLNWGVSYHLIAQEFVIWSRGLKSAQLNEKEKTIKFINSNNYNYSDIYTKQLLYGEQLQGVFENYPHSIMEDEFSEWVKEIDFSKPPIANQIKWSRGQISKSFPLLYSTMESIVFPELIGDTDLGGYNLSQLRRFFALMFLNFYYITCVESLIDSKYGVQNSFGSNPLNIKKSEIDGFISEITGLPYPVSQAIIKDLTFNPDSFHTSISIQPFILSSTNIYYILPNLFTQLNPQRVILGAMNKSPEKKKIYDRLINKIEKVNLKKIFDAISQIEKWNNYQERTIKFNNKQINPDLILIDKTEKFICIVDYKHFIVPITASEVQFRMNELEKGIRQIENYKIVLSKKGHLGKDDINNYKICGLLLTHRPLPIPIKNNINIGIADMDSFISKLGQNISLRNFWIDFYDYPNHKEIKKEFSKIESEVNVADWKIIREQFFLSFE